MFSLFNFKHSSYLGCVRVSFLFVICSCLILFSIMLFYLFWFFTIIIILFPFALIGPKPMYFELTYPSRPNSHFVFRNQRIKPKAGPFLGLAKPFSHVQPTATFCACSLCMASTTWSSWACLRLQPQAPSRPLSIADHVQQATLQTWPHSKDQLGHHGSPIAPPNTPIQDYSQRAHTSDAAPRTSYFTSWMATLQTVRGS